MSIFEPPSRISDAELIDRARAGDGAAYADLHERHHAAAVSAARHLGRDPHDVDDLVNEAFARVLAALRRGGGPTVAFRPYLLTTIRRLAYDRTDRRRRETPTEEIVEPGPVLDLTDGVEIADDHRLVVEAFGRLPERWQAVLWHTEVEGLRPAEVAPLLGLRPNAVAALAYRAREGLRQAYLTAHAGRGATPACERTVRDLGAYVRGGLTRRADVAVRSHLEECDRCRAAYLEVTELSGAFRAAIVLAVLGPTVAPHLLAAPPRPRMVPRPTPAWAGVGVGVGVVALVVAAVVAGLTGGGSARATAVPRSTAASSTPVADAAGPAVGSSPPVTSPPVTVAPSASLPPVLTRPPASAEPAPPSAIPPVREPAPTDDGPEPVVPPDADPAVPPGPAPTEPPAPVDPPDPVDPVDPREPVALVGEVAPVGALISGRHGLVALTVANEGAGTADAVVATARLAAPRRSIAAGLGPDAGCTVAGGALECRATDLGPGGVVTWYLPVTGDLPVGELAVSVTTEAPGVPGGARHEAPPMALPVAPPGPGVTARFADVLAGDVTLTGNSTLTCDDADPDCRRAQAGAPGVPLDNDHWPLVPVDVDGGTGEGRGTVTSSAAPLALPTGAEVVFATLHWAGSLVAGTGGGPPAASTVPGAVRFGAPGQAYRTVAAAPADVVVDAAGETYQSVADVTALVAGAGTYRVADVHSSTGRRAFGGWALVVVHTVPGAPARSIAVFDGQARVAPTSSADLAIGGYRVPDAGRAAARVGLVAFEGDAGIAGDAATLDGAPLVDARNPLGNVGNGTISRRGADVPGRLPGHATTFGLDVDEIDATGLLAPGSRHGTISLRTTQDVVHVGAVTAVVDVAPARGSPTTVPG